MKYREDMRFFWEDMDRINRQMNPGGLGAGIRPPLFCGIDSKA